jgi:2-keto-3-deoxy-L-rhamnonate aldolase RhmA
MRKIKDRLSAGEVIKGAVVNIVHPTLVELICGAGADFLFIDFEHGLRDYGDIAQALIVAEMCAVPALVRLGERSSNLVERMLDSGAAGFLFPQVSSAAEAAELVSWCRYKPVGSRGSGFARASLRHKGSEFDRRQQASLDVVCIMIVESLEGHANLAEILAVDGVTGVAIGPGDLSLALGVSDWNHPSVVSRLDEMAATVRQHPDKALLRLALSAEEAATHVAAGANMILVTHDVHLIGDLYSGLFGEIDRKVSRPTTDERV